MCASQQTNEVFCGHNFVYLDIPQKDSAHASAQGWGKWPATDPSGVEFSETFHPKWHARANQPLADGWRAAFCGLQGDQQWIHETMGLRSGLDVQRTKPDGHVG